MLILILINVQFLQNVVFSFENGSVGQNQSSGDSYYQIKKSPSKISYPPNGGNFPHPPHPVALFGKSCRRESSFIPAPKILKV